MRQLTLFEDPQTSDFKNFIIYRSSAGSGKTFTLVKEYLKIVLRNPQDYRHVLAITFTNKATEEMKFRILRDLQSMAAGDLSVMREKIEEEFAHFPQKLNIKDRAAKALKNILHDYSRFAISTIDHFFSQLVRALARELKLNMNYEIDVDDDTAMEESLHKLYGILHENPQLQEWIKDFAFNRIEQDKGWQLDYNLIEFGKELFKEKFHQGFSKLQRDEVNLDSLRELEQQLQLTRVNYENVQRAYAREALSVIRERGLKIDDFKYRHSGAANTFKNFLKGKFELKKRFRDVASGYDDWYTGNSLKLDDIRAAADSGLDRIAGDILAYDEKHYHAYVTAVQLQRHIYSYGLLDALSEQLKAYRQENNLMLLSHNSFLLKEIISDHEAPFLFEKLGSYYHHVLIDEFQDTSTYQWDNLKPLVSNALDQQHHVLLVGDVKQSIYRWRGGDLNLLLQKAKRDLALYQQQLQEETLQINRRSSKSIVDFNNKFFQAASQVLLKTEGLPDDCSMLTEVYREVKQESSQSKQGGVQVRFFDRDDNNWWEQCLMALVEVIKEHQGRGGQYRDILILLARNEEVTQVSEWLSKEDIPVISDQALRLSNNWAVRLMISAMHLLSDPEDSLACAEMAYLYQSGRHHNQLDFHELFLKARQHQSGLLAEYLPEKLVQQWPLLAHKGIFEWVCEVIPLLLQADDPNPFLERFMEVCLEQSAKGLHSVHDFLQWWKKNKHLQMVISPAHQDAIRIMTIHKAKGLESPVVIVPKADFEIKPRKDSIFWTDQLSEPYQKFKLLPLSFSSDLLQSHFGAAYQQELLEGLIEGLNMAYVAFTRPRDRLFVFSVKSKSEPKANDLGSINKLLWSICNQELWDGAWNPQHGVLTTGDLHEEISNSDQPTEAAKPIERLRVASYHHKVQIRSDAHKFFLLLDHQKAEKVREGLKIHAVLERLGRKKDLPAVIGNLWSQGLIDTGDIPVLKEKITQLFAEPPFGRWFDQSWEVFTEREIFSQGKRYKPDRVIIKDQQAIVIDYKREQEDQAHQQQVNAYAGLLVTMGYEVIEKYLVYVDDLKIVAL